MRSVNWKLPTEHNPFIFPTISLTLALYQNLLFKRMVNFSTHYVSFKPKFSLFENDAHELMRAKSINIISLKFCYVLYVLILKVWLNLQELYFQWRETGEWWGSKCYTQRQHHWQQSNRAHTGESVAERRACQDRDEPSGDRIPDHIQSGEI